MDIIGLIRMLGGLALFLYGMSMLGSSLEKVSGGRLENTLEKLSNNIFKAVLLGAVVTAAVQSSSATTVIVVGLVNANIIKLRQAIGVIMGANIGTTVTAHVLRLTDLEGTNLFLRLMKPESLAPISIMIGVLMFLACKRRKQKDIGLIFVGFGILFTGMLAMSDAVAPLHELPQFAQMFATFSNPIIGVLVGAVVTAIIQSSSASVGILQALSSTGMIHFSSAFPIIMGQNIGTCITPLLASIGASKNAKRAAAVHLSFNILGTVVFLIGVYTIKSVWGFSFWDDPITSGDIANFHTIFNLTITFMFMPFSRLLEKLACTLVKDKSTGNDMDITAINLDERFLRSPGLALEHTHKSVVCMAQLSYDNLLRTRQLFDKFDSKVMELINEAENVIDKYEDRIRLYLLKLSQRELSENDSRLISHLLQVVNEFERVGDYAINLADSAQYLFENNTRFSDFAQKELDVLYNAVGEIVQKSTEAFQTESIVLAQDIEPLEEVIDMIEETLRVRHIERLKDGKCSVDAAFPFVESLSALERVADHCSNVGVYIMTYQQADLNVDRHEYRRRLHMGLSEHYTQVYQQLSEKYYQKIH